MTKYVGDINEPKEIVTKEYVDAKDASLDASIAYVINHMNVKWEDW